MSDRKAHGVLYSLMLLVLIFIRLYKNFTEHINDDNILDLVINFIVAGVFVLVFYVCLLDSEIETKKYWYLLICSVVLLKLLDLINIPQIIELLMLSLILFAVLFSLKGFYSISRAKSKK